MTICVPKPPFEIIGKILALVFLWMWLPSVPLLIISSLLSNDLMVRLCFLLILLSISFWIPFIGVQKLANQTTFKWCDKK